MHDVVIFAGWVLAIGLVPYLIPAAMPSGRWLAGCVLLVGGGLAVLWTLHLIAVTRPGYQERFDDALAIGLFTLVTWGFAVGVAVRAFTLARRFRLRARLAVSVAGVAIMVALFAAPGAWSAWQRRPPSPACAAATFRVTVDGSHWRIPAASLFSIYRGPTAMTDVYRLAWVGDLRALCAATEDGTESLAATNLSFDFDRMRRFDRDYCTGHDADWSRALCAAFAGHRAVADTDYPERAFVFSVGQFQYRQFGGSPSSYAESLAAASQPRKSWHYVVSDVNTEDGRPLTFACLALGNGSEGCSASYAWSGAHLHYSFRARSDEVAARGLRVDATLRSFLAPLRDVEAPR